MSDVRKELHDALNDIASLQIRIVVQNERIADLERRICLLQEFIEQAQYTFVRDARQAMEMTDDEARQILDRAESNEDDQPQPV